MDSFPFAGKKSVFANKIQQNNCLLLLCGLYMFLFIIQRLIQCQMSNLKLILPAYTRFIIYFVCHSTCGSFFCTNGMLRKPINIKMRENCPISKIYYQRTKLIDFDAFKDLYSIYLILYTIYNRKSYS